jgi:hypothetical protein
LKQWQYEKGHVLIYKYPVFDGFAFDQNFTLLSALYGSIDHVRYLTYKSMKI